MQKKLFIVVNQDFFFLSHRLPIGLAAKEAGYDVTIISEDTGVSYKIREAGLKTINLPINKAGTNIKEEFVTFLFLYKLFRREKPDIVHLVGLKTMLWGSIACRLTRVKAMISAVCGLGILFDETHANSFMSQSILKVLRLTHHNKDNTKIIFQNWFGDNFFVRNNSFYQSDIQFVVQKHFQNLVRIGYGNISLNIWMQMIQLLHHFSHQMNADSHGCSDTQWLERIDGFHVLLKQFMDCNNLSCIFQKNFSGRRNF